MSTRRPSSEELTEIRVSLENISTRTEGIETTVTDIKQDIKTMSQKQIETLATHGLRLDNLEESRKTVKTVLIGLIISTAGIVIEIVFRFFMGRSV